MRAMVAALMTPTLFRAPLWFRLTDFGLAWVRTLSTLVIALRVAETIRVGQPFRHAEIEGAVLAFGVVLPVLIRQWVLWPNAREPVPTEGLVPGEALAFGWPAPGGRYLRHETRTCWVAGSLGGLAALGQSSWWGRYRALVLEITQRRNVLRVVLAAVCIVAWTFPSFQLQQVIGYGSLFGEWNAAGFVPWLRSLLRIALGVGVSALLWWAALMLPLHLGWGLLALLGKGGQRLSRNAGRWLWVASGAWFVLPTLLILSRIW